ncbi:hypothetical protein V8C86DRAFT_656425 [Haematococcus lacustris]
MTTNTLPIDCQPRGSYAMHLTAKPRLHRQLQSWSVICDVSRHPKGRSSGCQMSESCHSLRIHCLSSIMARLNEAAMWWWWLGRASQATLHHQEDTAPPAGLKADPGYNHGAMGMATDRGGDGCPRAPELPTPGAGLHCAAQLQGRIRSAAPRSWQAGSHCGSGPMSSCTHTLTCTTVLQPCQTQLAWTTSRPGPRQTGPIGRQRPIPC